MKKLIALAMAFSFVLFLSSPLLALPAPVEKIKTGVVDIIKSPLEIGHHSMDEMKGASFKPFGLIGGMMKGTGYAVKKAVKGAIDVATFPLDKKDK